MWCMPRDSAMSGVIVSTGSGHVSAVMASSSRCPLSRCSGGCWNTSPRCSKDSSTVHPGPIVAISRIVPSGSLK